MQDFIIKLIQLLKPRFYNRITWLVVLTGLTLMGTPFWEEIVYAILNKKYNLDLTPGGNVPWGFALVTLGLFYHLLNTSLHELITHKIHAKEKKQSEDHDKKIYQNSQTIMREDDFTYFLESLLTDHSYLTNQTTLLYKISDYHRKTENQFLDASLSASVQNFIIKINELHEWIAGEFFVYPENQKSTQLRLCMQPHLNIDRGGYSKPGDREKYDKCTQELNRLADEAGKAYKEYRSSIKTKLFI